METKRVKIIPFNLSTEDIDVLRSVVRSELDNGWKARTPGEYARRVRLYRLNRRLHRARLELER